MTDPRSLSDKFGKVRNLCPGYTKRNQRGAG
jgi:hypothetical protein